jgi:Tryptophan RNA-binding attenuator protein inhibitory protein
MTSPYTVAEFPNLIAKNGGMIRTFVDVGIDPEHAPTELADEIKALNAVIEQLGPHFERIAVLCGYDFSVENRGGLEEMILPALLGAAESPCRRCESVGLLSSDAYGEIDCGECDGTGYVLSADGRALVAFINRHMRGGD